MTSASPVRDEFCAFIAMSADEVPAAIEGVQSVIAKHDCMALGSVLWEGSELGGGRYQVIARWPCGGRRGEPL